MNQSMFCTLLLYVPFGSFQDILGVIWEAPFHLKITVEGSVPVEEQIDCRWASEYFQYFVGIFWAHEYVWSVL